MSNIPTRSENNIFAEILVKTSMNKKAYYIFVEDECTPSIYLKIINKVVPEMKVDKVIPLKSKKEVLKKFNEWKVDIEINRKCFFIVDKDFDHWQGMPAEINDNLLELPVYTLENLFFTPEAALIIVNTYGYGKDGVGNNIFELDYWKDWQNNICAELENLFLSFAVVVKNNLELENCGQNPAKFIDFNYKQKRLALKEDIVHSYIDDVKEKMSTQELIYEGEVNDVKKFYLNNGSLDYRSLIKGKYLLFAMLSKIKLDIMNDNIYHKSIDNALLSTLVYELESECFSCFNKLKNI